jgi:enamine deaminase RidA (YjgF/YER057c/UK114 family)
VGDSCWVSGTTDAGPDGRSQHPGDAAAQARTVFTIIERALAEGGFALADVVRLRVFVVDIAAHWEPVARVMGELFGEIRPASTMVEVSALIDATLLVEIEADARRASSG